MAYKWKSCSRLICCQIWFFFFFFFTANFRKALEVNYYYFFHEVINLNQINHILRLRYFSFTANFETALEVYYYFFQIDPQILFLSIWSLNLYQINHILRLKLIILTYHINYNFVKLTSGMSYFIFTSSTMLSITFYVDGLIIWHVTCQFY